jgi:hypothetical protein
MKQGMDLDKRSARHYEGKGESFPGELVEALKSAIQEGGLSPVQAAEGIGITVNILSQVLNNGTPKGARKVRAKINAWFDKVKKDKEKE